MGKSMADTPVDSPIKHDMRGMIQRDIAHLRSLFKVGRYKPTMTIEDIMYKEGQQSILHYIEEKMIAGR